MADDPIGIFDSGFGGLTVARAVLDQLPDEAVLYVGDTARQPYGPRPIAEVRRYALECRLDREDHEGQPDIDEDDERAGPAHRKRIAADDRQ